MTQFSVLANQISAKSPLLPTTVLAKDFIDSFANPTKISTSGGIISSGYTYNSGWKAALNTRSGADSLYGNGFANTTGLTLDTGGTANVTRTTNTNNDPDLANYMLLSTGTTAGSLCGFHKTANLGSIPSSFTMDIAYSLVNVGASTQASLVATVQNTVNNKYVQLLINDNQILVANSAGGYTSLSSIVGTSLAKLWLDIADNGNGTHTLTPYDYYVAGTPVTVTLPTGIGGNAGKVSISQNSAAGNTSRVSEVFRLNIGSSVLQDGIIIFCTPFTATAAGAALNTSFLLEDLDGNLSGVTPIIRASNDGGVNFTPLTVTDQGVVTDGRIKSTKKVRLFTAPWANTISVNDSLVYELIISGAYVAVHSSYMEVA